MYLKLSLFVLIAVISRALAAPKPIDFDEIGRRVRYYGQKALPAVKSICGLINSYQGYQQNSGFPSNIGYPQLQGYPQYPQYYPQNPQNIGPVSPSFSASQNFPTAGSQNPSVGVSEQEDLNKLFSSTNFGGSQNVPPQIQDILKNFNNLPKLGSPAVNTVQNNKLIDYNNLDNNVI